MRNKDKIENPPSPHPPVHPDNFTAPPTPLPCHTGTQVNNSGMVGIGGLWSAHNCSSLHLLPVPAWVLSMGCCSSGCSCSSVDSDMSCREITAPPWSPWAGGAVPVPEYLFHLLRTLCSRDYFSLLFPTFLTACAVFTLP